MDKDYSKALKKVVKIRNERQKIYGDSWKTSFISNYYQIRNKIDRLTILLDSKRNEYESKEDTLIDLINYSLFALAMLEKEKKK